MRGILPAGKLQRRCEECGAPFEAKRANQRWCGSNCSKKRENRVMCRGFAIHDKLIAWRQSRGKKQTLSDIAAIVDGWIREDRERLSPPA